MRPTIQIVLIVAAFSLTTNGQADPPSSPVAPLKLVVGGKFKEALDKPLSVDWTERPLRPGLRQLVELKQTAILLDRRIDPDSKVSLKTGLTPLDDLIEQAVASSNAIPRVVGNTIYVGPAAATERLRTVVEIRATELAAASAGKDKSLLGLFQRHDVSWPDLSTPREIIAQIEKRFGLQVDDVDRVPHDLWAGAELPSATATEALMLVLGQFDLAFEWGQGARVKVIPLPEAPTLERTYEVGTKAATVGKELPSKLPELTVVVRGTKLVVRGSVADHEAVEALLHPERQVVRRPSTRPKSKVVYTFEVPNAPLSAFMQKFAEQSGYRFEFDQAAFTAAGIDLDRRVNLKLKSATLSELLHAMFDDFGVAFEIDGMSIKLRVK